MVLNLITVRGLQRSSGRESATSAASWIAVAERKGVKKVRKKRRRVEKFIFLFFVLFVFVFIFERRERCVCCGGCVCGEVRLREGREVMVMGRRGASYITAILPISESCFRSSGSWRCGGLSWNKGKEPKTKKKPYLGKTQSATKSIGGRSVHGDSIRRGTGRHRDALCGQKRYVYIARRLVILQIRLFSLVFHPSGEAVMYAQPIAVRLRSRRSLARSAIMKVFFGGWYARLRFLMLRSWVLTRTC
jgi:hypothetical protein